MIIDHQSHLISAHQSHQKKVSPISSAPLAAWPQPPAARTKPSPNFGFMPSTFGFICFGSTFGFKSSTLVIIGVYIKTVFINVSHHIKGINKRRNLARGVWRDTGISNHIDHRETWHENSRLVGLEINSFESLFQELSIYQLSYVTGVRTNPVMVRYVLLHVIISLRYILSNTCLCVQLSGEIMGSKLEVVSPIWVEDWG